MAFGFNSLLKAGKKNTARDTRQEFKDLGEKTGFIITYEQNPDGLAIVSAISTSFSAMDRTFPSTATDEARIMYRQACEILRSRAKINADHETINKAVKKLFSFYHNNGEFSGTQNDPVKNYAQKEFIANPGKKLEINVDGTTYLRLPIKTRIITTKDTDILPLLDEYVKPHLEPGDLIFISEKALTVTQGRIVNMSDIKTTPLSRFLAHKVQNRYGEKDFHGFGHGTDMAMQLLLEETGYLRVLFAAAVSALTRPLGIRGLFYQICGERAKSIDCPMSFLILEYAHFAKLAPDDPSGVARKIKEYLGYETVILDANYRGAFSLGKSTRAISEEFIQKLFQDNPLGQSDEMTPFCIVRKSS